MLTWRQHRQWWGNLVGKVGENQLVSGKETAQNNEDLEEYPAERPTKD